MSDLKSFLPLFLNGPAFAIYKQLSSEEKDDYEKMKAALLSAFGMNCYAAYDQLQRSVLQDGETVDVYLADLRRLVTLMRQSTPESLLKVFIYGWIAIRRFSAAEIDGCCRDT